MTSHPNRSKKNPKPGSSPTPAQVRAAREAAGLTQTQAAELIYCRLRTWQNWEAEGPEHRPMHPAFWELWSIYVQDPERVARVTGE